MNIHTTDKNCDPFTWHPSGWTRYDR